MAKNRKIQCKINGETDSSDATYYGIFELGFQLLFIVNRNRSTSVFWKTNLSQIKNAMEAIVDDAKLHDFKSKICLIKGGNIKNFFSWLDDANIETLAIHQENDASLWKLYQFRFQIEVLNSSFNWL